MHTISDNASKFQVFESKLQQGSTSSETHYKKIEELVKPPFNLEQLVQGINAGMEQNMRRIVKEEMEAQIKTIKVPEDASPKIVSLEKKVDAMTTIIGDLEKTCQKLSEEAKSLAS